MEIEILGTETLGVRGLSTSIDRILIDPGVALGFSRYNLHPHPVQAVVGDEVKGKIVSAWESAEDIIISHLHGDHIPLLNPNPFQLGIEVLPSNSDARIWVKAEKFCRGVERIRFTALKRRFGDQMVEAKPGVGDGLLEFIGPFPHTGRSNTMVLGTIVRKDGTLLHLSDADISSWEVIRAAKRINPDFIIADGPSLYRLDREYMKSYLSRASKLVNSCGSLIVDHHLMRCDEGVKWLNSLKKIGEGKCNVFSASEFMLRPFTMLEAWRRTLYRLIPVSNNWFRGDLLLKGLKDYCREIWPEIRRSMDEGRPHDEKSFEKVLRRALESARVEVEDFSDVHKVREALYG